MQKRVAGYKYAHRMRAGKRIRHEPAGVTFVTHLVGIVCDAHEVPSFTLARKVGWGQWVKWLGYLEMNIMARGTNCLAIGQIAPHFRVRWRLEFRSDEYLPLIARRECGRRANV